MSKPTTRAEVRPQSPFKLPYRGGSIQMRHGRWWLVYSDADGDQVQRNSKTADPAAAFRQLVDAVIEVSMLRLDGLLELQRQLNETAHAQTAGADQGGGEAGHSAGQRRSRRSIRNDAGVGAQGKTTSTRGGKR